MSAIIGPPDPADPPSTTPVVSALQEELRQTRQLLERTLAALDQALLVVDPATRTIRSANPAVERVFGYAAAEVVGCTTEMLHVDHEHFVAFGRLARAGLDAHGVFQTEYPMRRKDGRTIFTEHVVTEITDADGVRNGQVTAVRDITRRKDAEQQLARLARDLQLVTDSVPALIAYVDSDVRYRFNNKAYGEWFGFEPDALNGQHLRDVLGEAAYERVRAHVEAALGGQRVAFEAEVPYRVGGTRHVHAEYVPDARPDGSVAGYYALITDVSDRRRADDALRKSEAHFRGLADAMPQLVWTARPDGTVQYYNSRAREYGGLAQMASGAWQWEPIVHEDDMAATRTAWQHAVQAGVLYQCEHRIRMADGSYRWHLSRALPMRNEAGTIVEWFGTATDVHELREAQQVLHENDRRKDEFLAMLAHELRNPLAPILNAVHVLKRSMPPDPQLGRMRDVIERQAEHLTRLVDDLLDVARITQGKIELRRERIDLTTLVGRAVETSRPLIEARRHQLHVALPDEAVGLEGDATRLVQVVSNLLHNAAKYTEDGGRIWLTAERTGSAVRLRVRDDGIGIPAADLPTVFDLFAQAHRSLDRSHGGLGVGLTLVKRLVEMHGGRVEARSAGTGHGSEFIVELPTVEPRRAETEAAEGVQQAAPGGCRVLVVDDNVDSAESMAMLLQFEGHEVGMAVDGPSALEAARRMRPHVVLLDIGLPGITGYELAQHLRRDASLGRPVLMALTGYGQAEDRARSRAAGFDHHLTKPVNYDTLSALIRSYIFE
jgi:two-component system, chemotaxis family, CheB/CheR fusion protein